MIRLHVKSNQAPTDPPTHPFQFHTAGNGDVRVATTDGETYQWSDPINATPSSFLTWERFEVELGDPAEDSTWDLTDVMGKHFQVDLLAGMNYIQDLEAFNQERSLVINLTDDFSAEGLLGQTFRVCNNTPHNLSIDAVAHDVMYEGWVFSEQYNRRAWIKPGAVATFTVERRHGETTQYLKASEDFTIWQLDEF